MVNRSRFGFCFRCTEWNNKRWWSHATMTRKRRWLMRHHKYKIYLFDFPFGFICETASCWVHISWLTVSCLAVSARFVFCIVLSVGLVGTWYITVAFVPEHHSLRLRRRKHFGISIMSLFSKGEIQIANATRISAKPYMDSALLDNLDSNYNISIVCPVRVCVDFHIDAHARHTMPPLIRSILFSNVYLGSEPALFSANANGNTHEFIFISRQLE